MHTQVLSPDILPPGTMLGRYELIKRVAVGGMAELYLARATGIEGFEKLVALKRILPQHAGNEELVTMFLDEARLAATLQHANVAQVYDIGQTPQGLFFTMEFIHGEDVRSLLKNRARADERVPLSHVLAIVSGTAAGLHAAHEKTGRDGELLGIVHRDVSPANILVSYDGCVKLVDFGVAKAARQQSETRAGTLKGKIAYMAPEQCLGERVDRRTDVFALGIVLYELTTGERLFQGDNEFKIMKRIVGEDVPPPSQVRADYPMKLEAIVLKALARDPEQRYPTAQAFQLALETFARDSGHSISSVDLGSYMRSVFRARLASWDEVLHNLADGSEPEIEISGGPTPRAPSVADGVPRPVSNVPLTMETWMFSGPVPGAVPRVGSAPLSGPNPKAMVPDTRVHELERERPVWMMPLVSLCAVGAIALGLVFYLTIERPAAADVDHRPPAREVGAPLAPLDPPVQLPQASPVEVAPAVQVEAEPPAPVRARVRPNVTTPRRASKSARAAKARKPAPDTWNADSALPPM